MLLRTTGLTRRFGGLTAVDSVDFAIREGELCSLIGPNGAGKTTFFNLLTGVLPPSEGIVEYRENTASDNSATGGPGESSGNGERGDAGEHGDPGERGGWVDITDDEPHETALRGIHRSYQITNIFPTMTVLENVRIAAQAHGGTDSWKLHRNVGGFAEYTEEAYAILDRIGLIEETETVAQNLSHGQKRNLEVGIALAGDPDLLLLDEPTAGVSSDGIDRIVALIENVAADHAILLVEHNMDVVMGVSDRIAVLHQGELIAEGPPEEIRGDEDVQEAYLGGYKPGSENREEPEPTDARSEGPDETEGGAGA